MPLENSSPAENGKKKSQQNERKKAEQSGSLPREERLSESRARSAARNMRSVESHIHSRIDAPDKARARATKLSLRSLSRGLRIHNMREFLAALMGRTFSLSLSARVNVCNNARERPANYAIEGHNGRRALFTLSGLFDAWCRYMQRRLRLNITSAEPL